MMLTFIFMQVKVKKKNKTKKKMYFSRNQILFELLKQQLLAACTPFTLLPGILNYFNTTTIKIVLIILIFILKCFPVFFFFLSFYTNL